MPHIFISYRRGDVGFSGRLYDRIRQYYGSESVFLDIANIQLGSDFASEIEEHVSKSDILLAVIGRAWTDPDGIKRLDNDFDTVRIEIESALRNNITVIPVLVEGARLPARRDLPVTLEDLGRRKALEVTHADFDLGMDRIIRAVDTIIGETSQHRDEVQDEPFEKDARDLDPNIIAGIVDLTKTFFAAAGRPVHTGSHQQLLFPGPIWIVPTPDPTPYDVAEFSEDRLSPGQRGFLVYRGTLTTQTSVFLDRLRVEGKSIVPIKANLMTSSIVDGNEDMVLADLDRRYESGDNLFDTKNAVIDERYFFGRSALLAQVGSAMARGEHVLITGLRKSGKTSFLNILRQHLSSHPVCFVDLQRYDRHSEDWPSELFQLILMAYDSWGKRNFSDWPGKAEADPPPNNGNTIRGAFGRQETMAEREEQRRTRHCNPRRGGESFSARR
jgi:hypothetical protein